MAQAFRYEYSEQGHGGIGYRLDIWFDQPGTSGNHAFTTNPDGSGLFFHNGAGNRIQSAGNGQFTARSMRQFKARTAQILENYQRDYGHQREE